MWGRRQARKHWGGWVGGWVGFAMCTINTPMGPVGSELGARAGAAGGCAPLLWAVSGLGVLPCWGSGVGLGVGACVAPRWGPPLVAP